MPGAGKASWPLVGLAVPNDGKTYGVKRSNNVPSIVEVTQGTGGGIPEAPTDGKLYGRKSSEWTEATSSAVGAAPSDHSHAYQATSEKGQANGYAGLDSGGKVPAAQLPAPAADGEASVLLGSDRTNNTTTFADATGLSFTALAGQTYLIEFDLVYTTNATTTGIQLGVAGSVALGLLAGRIVGFTAATTIAGRHFATYNESGRSLASALAGSNYASVRCVFKAGGSDTTFVLRFAAEASTTGTSVTIKAGSVLRYRKVS